MLSFVFDFKVFTMKFVKFLLFAILVKICSSYEEIDDMIVEINDGKILGRHIYSTSGRTIRAFTNVPYAAPPIGNLRFKPPQKPIPWNNTLTTQSHPPKCFQFNPFIRSFVVDGQEDCLYLNVYAPLKGEKKLPVIVWMHGGVWLKNAFQGL